VVRTKVPDLEILKFERGGGCFETGHGGVGNQIGRGETKSSGARSGKGGGVFKQKKTLTPKDTSWGEENGNSKGRPKGGGTAPH